VVNRFPEHSFFLARFLSGAANVPDHFPARRLCTVDLIVFFIGLLGIVFLLWMF